MAQPAAYIVDALRTAGGRRNGKLAGWHPADLGGAVLDAIVARSGIDPAAIEDVIMGCVSQGGEQAFQIGRNAVLASGLPESVPAVSIDRQCGSSQQAIQFAAQAVMSGTQDVVIAAGVESMTRVPMFSTGKLFQDAGLGVAKSPGQERRYPGIAFSQFVGAEMMARKYGLSRDDLDRYALESHRRAAAAAERGDFDAEIVPLEIQTPEGPALHRIDEGIRFDTSLEAIGGVKTLQEGGVVTAANASQICDGASAVLVVSEAALKAHGLTPLARIHNLTVTAGDPVIMLEEPLIATERALRKAGMTIGEIDLYEVNEAFASVPLAWLKHSGADPEKLNVHGGAIALGHPLGASGTKLMATLVHALRRRGARYGLQTMCEAGGVANVTIVERL
ncbi:MULTISPECIES: acetyl-CoA C-acetyltransferase [unclassified Sphingomonas]|uniref:acetyl-CoA C-acetyltransferase n=1 Tax=unclassified Sphingomonas TaxID=196159 RepID=UPI0006F4FA0E|nr:MULTISPECIES: acetyl-CoA C-acetyltransferase [unclassified Sphingomonas]KQX18749.1 acetyl-CoA acetyltransferase [Sphingomonas sp. Root1294]KQY71927.1 acetyl-CoA acetyltransferase [Sphingomonas sp. Root50]KRB94808.1 acetyl-CoA acetyltransferase [Sphingomonas sp. Root720]